MLEQLRGQGDLTGRLDPQPGTATQFDEQSIGGRWRAEFHLHKGGRGFESGPPMTPAAEGGVVDAVFAREGGGGYTAPIKRRQQSGALDSRGALGPGETRRSFHCPRLPRSAAAQQGVAKSPLTVDRTIERVALEAAIADKLISGLEKHRDEAAKGQEKAIVQLRVELKATKKQINLLLDMRLNEQVSEPEYVSKKHILVIRRRN